MNSFLAILAAFAAVVAPILGVPAPLPHLKIRNPLATDVLPDSYIVVYNTDVNATMIAAHMESVASILSKRDAAGGVGANYEIGDFKGFQVQADSATIAEIADSPEVAYIEKDARVYISALTSQTGAAYGLSRISHRNPGADTYVYDTSAGEGATVFVIDTGIYTGHSQFGGRASMGANFAPGSANTDEDGHGTHCAGTIGGSTYGVAKKVKLVGVKVIGPDRRGAISTVIQGIQWVADNAGPKSVLSMSLGGDFSAAENAAVRNTVAKGVTVVVGAGNDDDDASKYSPGSEPSVITVGAIDDQESRAFFSNYGSVLDVFAVGVDVLSSWIGGPSATKVISGTSMATPHIAGLAAYLMALEGLNSPADVVKRIQALATSGKIADAQSANNLIAYNGSGS